MQAFIQSVSSVFDADLPQQELFASLLSLLEEHKITADDVKKMSVFNEEKYGRVLVAFKPKFTVVMCCFLPGQTTPKHSHGDHHVEAFVKVIQGSVVLTKFSSPSEPNEPEDTVYPAEAVFHLDSSIGEHQLHNEESTSAISLHIYTPPYIACAFISIEGKESSLPIIYTPSTYCNAMEQLQRSLKTDTFAFTNLPCMVELLRDSILPLKKGELHSQAHIDEIISLLSKIRINDDEWLQYSQFHSTKYTRNLIGYDSKFTAILLCWEKGQMSPIHDHAGSSCWVKVLKGTLREVRYHYPQEKPGQASSENTTESYSSICSKSENSFNDIENRGLSVLSDVTFSEEGVTYINDTQGLHMMGNATSDEVAVSLHIYSPPYKQCHVFDAATGDRRLASITAANQPDCPFKSRSLEKCDESKDADSPLSYLGLRTFAEQVKKAIDMNRHNELPDLLDQLVLDPMEWGQYVHFDEYRYTRSLVINHEDFSLMILCWNKGQNTPVHAHREGTQAYFKVLKGNLLLRIYSKTETECAEIERKMISESSGASHCCIPTVGEPLMHKLGNASISETAVSLHLYTPAYIECKYEKKGEVHRIPVVHCTHGIKSEKGDMSPATCSIQHSLKTHTKIFTNLCSFVGSIRHEKWTGMDMTRILSSFEFNRCEWRQFLQSAPDPPSPRTAYACKSEGAKILPQICTVAVDEDFTVVVSKWISGVCPAIDYDGSRLWIKVLEGELREESFGEGCDGGLEVARSGSLKCGDVAYFGPRIVHSIANEGKEAAVALMVFRGPLRAIYRHCIETKQRFLVKRFSD